MRKTALVLTTMLLSACSSAPPRPQIAQYDLSPSPAPIRPISLRSLEVVPPSWLLGNAMHYRLAYSDTQRREQYATSRWTAPPGEMVRVRLQQLLTNVRNRDQAACRLRVDLDDLVQVFDSPGNSRLVMDGRASLYGTQVSFIARRPLHIEQPAGSDAVGGVAASGNLVSALADELTVWVEENCPKTAQAPQPAAPQTPAIGARPAATSTSPSRP